MSIYAVNLTEFNDRGLKAAVNQVPENSVILFEDIDCMRTGEKRGKEGKTEQGVTLSGLLNVLDGFHAPENVLFAMTTNHAEALDPALLRPGRIDYRLLLGRRKRRGSWRRRTMRKPWQSSRVCCWRWAWNRSRFSCTADGICQPCRIRAELGWADWTLIFRAKPSKPSSRMPQ